jgi:hypothetical protein
MGVEEITSLLGGSEVYWVSNPRITRKPLGFRFAEEGGILPEHILGLAEYCKDYPRNQANRQSGNPLEK